MSGPLPARGARLAAAIGSRVYRVLLLAYPSELRAEHGDEAATVFAQACADTWTERGGGAVLRRLAHAILTVPRDGLFERLSSRTCAARSGPSRLFADLHGDVRFAGRSIRRRPLLAAGVIVTLALGIGSNTAMFSVVDATLLRPLPYRDADRVVYVRSRTVDDARLSDPAVEDLQRWGPRLTSLERIEARTWKSVLLAGEEGATRIRMLQVTAGYLTAVGSRRVAGRDLQPEDSRAGAAPVVIISERLWRGRYGARTDLIGRSVEIDSVRHTVVGVVTDVTSDTPGLRFSVIGPLLVGGAEARTSALGVAWLKQDTTIEAARAELQSVSAAVDSRGRPTTATLEPPSNVFWEADELRDPQLALMAGVSLLLMIACVNVATLLLGAGQYRAQELAVRLALGATRLRVARLLLVEALVLAVAGGALGLLLASYAVHFFAAMDPGVQLQTRLEAIRLDARIVVYAFGIATLTAGACGVLPALRGSAAPQRASLLQSGRTASPLRRWPQVFIAVELAVSFVLLVASGLVGQAFLRMHLAEPGFAANRVLGVRIALPDDGYRTDARRSAFFDELVLRARRLPGVTAVGLGYGAMPPSDLVVVGALAAADGRAFDEEVQVTVSFVEPGYFDLMGIPLLSGTDFTSGDSRDAGAGERPVVVSDSFSRRFWRDRDPVGAGFTLTDRRGSRRYRIIGVAGDANGRGRINPTCEECQWQIHLPLPATRQYTDVLMRMADGAPPPVAALRAAITDIDPGVPADDGLETAAASLSGALALPRFRAVLFGGFAALSVVLVAFGVLAVVFHAVEQRTREIGIRLALGGRPPQVRREMLAAGLRPAWAGIAAGALLAVLLTRGLMSFLHGVSTIDPVVYFGSAALLLLVAMGATLVPVLRATGVNPATVLRNE